MVPAGGVDAMLVGAGVSGAFFALVALGLRRSLAA